MVVSFPFVLFRFGRFVSFVSFRFVRFASFVPFRFASFPGSSGGYGRMIPNSYGSNIFVDVRSFVSFRFVSFPGSSGGPWHCGCPRTTMLALWGPSALGIPWPPMELIPLPTSGSQPYGPSLLPQCVDLVRALVSNFHSDDTQKD